MPTMRPIQLTLTDRIIRRLWWYLTLGTLINISLGTLAHIAVFQWLASPELPVARILQRIELTHEPSLSQWYSTLLFLIAAALFAAIGWVRKKIQDGDAKYWFILSFLATLASIDEAIMLHEMLDRPTREAFNLSGALTIAWIIPGAIVAILTGLSLIPFLCRLPRLCCVRFVGAATVFFAGAILMEIPGGYFFDRYGFETPHYIATYAVEEWLEQMAVGCLIYSLLHHLKSQAFCLSAQTITPTKRPTAPDLESSIA